MVSFVLSQSLSQSSTSHLNLSSRVHRDPSTSISVAEASRSSKRFRETSATYPEHGREIKRVRDATPIRETFSDEDGNTDGEDRRNETEDGPVRRFKRSISRSALTGTTATTLDEPRSLESQSINGETRTVVTSDENGSGEGSCLFSEQPKIGDRPHSKGRRHEIDDIDELSRQHRNDFTRLKEIYITQDREEFGDNANIEDFFPDEEASALPDQQTTNDHQDPSPGLGKLSRFVASASPSTSAIPAKDRMAVVIEGQMSKSGKTEYSLPEDSSVLSPYEDGSDSEDDHEDDEPEDGQYNEYDEKDSPSSYHSGDTDEYEMDYRPILERTVVKRDICILYNTIEGLRNDSSGEPRYMVVDRLGEGTFSSVYLAKDCLHNQWDNEYWTGRPDNDDPRERRSDVKVALKKILVTSSPARIENELHILESLRGCRNVSQLITAFREEDQVIIVLPFHPSDDFRQFYKHMDAHHIRQYTRTLFQALKDIHQRGIIHRDVKPANFLFDYESGRGVLVDFGLAERYCPPRKPTCQHAPATLSTLQGSKISTSETPAVEQAVYNARKRSKLGEGRVGFPQDDKRPAIKTNRAGTRGFRAPEVLLKCPDQTVAIDIWSAGVMLLSMLTHKFPVFNSTDDIEALMEIAAIFGRPAMERCATLHNRTIISNVPSLDIAPQSLTSVILSLNPHVYTPPFQHPTPEQSKEHIESMDQAIDLCHRLLRLDSTKRITAANALRHRFLRDGGDKEDLIPEEKVPLLKGDEGKCGKLHGYTGDKHQAFFAGTLQDMQFGQGIPNSTEELCPEHEHWQQRIGINPLRLCSRFSRRDDGDEDEMEVLGERDVNVNS